MKRRSEKFDSFDTNVGKYSARKVPKWHCNNSDLVDYLASIDEDGSILSERLQPRLSS